MNAINISIVLESGANIPSYATSGAAGADLRSTERLILPSGARAMVRTGVRMAIPAGFEVQIRPRSGLAIKHGITMVNSPGTIDSDYRGEVKVLMINHGHEPFTIEVGERIAQMVVCPVVRASFEVVNDLEETQRGEGGFGSTGRV